MSKNFSIGLYVSLLVISIIGVDVLFFRHHTWARLMANIGIVLIFAAFALRFLPNKS